MRWLQAFFTGGLCGVAGAFLALFLGDIVTRAHHVSDFEGGRGYFVVFIFMPAGFLIGLIAGIVVSRLGGAGGFAGFARSLGLALLVTGGLLGAIGGVSYLAADQPPTLAGQPLALEFEIRVPDGTIQPESLEAAGFRASLSSTRSDNRYAELRFGAISPNDGYVDIPGSASILTDSPARTLLVGDGSVASQVFDLKLRGKPRREDEAWSPWLPADRRADLSPLNDADRYALRYRVRPDTT